MLEGEYSFRYMCTKSKIGTRTSCIASCTFVLLFYVSNKLSPVLSCKIIMNLVDFSKINNLYFVCICEDPWKLETVTLKFMGTF